MRCLVVAALCAIVGSHPAVADTSEDDANARLARERYEQGLTHYQVGEFAAAIAEFKAAYELSKKPGLLFNLAQAYRLDHQWGQAAYSYRTYLRLVPETPDREEVEGLIAEADREQAKLDREQAKAKADREAKAIAAASKATPATGATGVTGATGAAGESDRAARRRHVRNAGWITSGGGALVAGVGVYFAVRASSSAAELTKLADDGGAWSESYARVEHDGRRDDLIGSSLLWTGGIAMLAGTALVVWSLVSDEPPAHVSITPASGGGGVLWLDLQF